MANWFEFAGVRSTDLGVCVREFPDIVLPEERAEFLTVAGRSGYLTQMEGDAVYSDLSLSIDCILASASNVDAVSAWLRTKGSGRLILGNMPDRYYIARSVNQIDLKRLMRGRAHRTFAAVFRCQPYRYMNPPVAALALTNGGTIENPGNIDAEPVVALTGSGDITLTIGSKTLEISGLSGGITVDVALGVAYATGVTPLVPLTGSVGRDGWPFTIPPGEHAVGWTGSVASAQIEPRWRCV